jgi:hypothetical protein
MEGYGSCWTGALDISEAQLRAADATVGVSAEAVGNSPTA